MSTTSITCFSCCLLVARFKQVLIICSMNHLVIHSNGNNNNNNCSRKIHTLGSKYHHDEHHDIKTDILLCDIIL